VTTCPQARYAGYMNSVSRLTDQPKFRVGVVSSKLSDQVYALRRQAYSKSPEIEWLDTKTLDWSPHDDRGVVLGVWAAVPESDAETLVASFRLSWFPDQKSTEDFLEYSLSNVPPRFPTLVPTRAVSAIAFRRFGLHALMRNAYLRVLPRMPVQSMVSIVYDSAPRMASLLKLGYLAYPCDRHWDTEARPKREPLVLTLPAEGFAGALAGSDKQVSAAGLTVTVDESAIEQALLALGAND